MTCIVGLVHDGRVYIGGDSAAADGYDMTVRADEKVFRNGPFLFGFTSSFRMGQLLRYAFEPPEHDPSVDTYRFMVTTFIDAVRECLKRGGWAKTSDGQEEGGTFLVGYRGRLFAVFGDFQVAESADGFDAVGCGFQIARGALYATRTFCIPPEERVRLALEAAERFSAGVRGPFVIECLEDCGCWRRDYGSHVHSGRDA